ncbi:MAG: PqiC family protein [bacterium]
MISLPPRAVRTLMGVAAGIGLAALAACSSPPTRFYTLGAGDSIEHAPSVANANLRIDTLAVRVPAPVAGSRLVVQVSPSQVALLEDDRWASSLSDEIRGALSAQVAGQSNTVDVHGIPHSDDVPVYRIAVDVQRFESWQGSHVLIDAVWSVRPAQSQQALICRAVIRKDVSLGNNAMVDGHRRALKDIASQIVAGIRSVASAPVASCPASADADRIVRGQPSDSHN